MAFNAKQFTGTQFVPREDGVSVPDLKGFFEEGDEPVWRVRGLTGHELGRVNEAAERYKSIAAIIEGIAGSAQREKVESIKQLVGLGDDTPSDVVRRLDMIVLGSVEPKVDEGLALKLCTAFPIEFYQITNKITELTGQGHVVGK